MRVWAHAGKISEKYKNNTITSALGKLESYRCPHTLSAVENDLKNFFYSSEREKRVRHI
jgi:hypothetical protein